MKTPQEIAADVYWTATDATTGPAIRALIVAGIEADRAQRRPSGGGRDAGTGLIKYRVSNNRVTTPFAWFITYRDAQRFVNGFSDSDRYIIEEQS